MRECIGWARAGLMALLLAGNLASACGDGGGGDAVASYAGQRDSLTVTPGEAGKLELGAVKVQFPPGAVDKEVEVTLDVRPKKGLPDEANVAIDVYEFGPSMQFNKPVELEFDLSGVKVPNNKKAVVAVLDEATMRWKKLDDSSVSNGKAKGSTLHFSMFTVVFELSSSAPGSGQVSGECSDTFDACGGDLVGTWAYSGACATAPLSAIIDEDDPLLSCDVPPTAMFGIDILGTVEFGADGSIRVDEESTVVSGFSVPLACLEQLGAQAGASPEELCSRGEGTFDGSACVVRFEEMDTTMDVGTYSVEGGTLYVDTESVEGGTADGDTISPGEPTAPVSPTPSASYLKQIDTSRLEYCVQGDTLTVRMTDSYDGSVMQYTATRQ